MLLALMNPAAFDWLRAQSSAGARLIRDSLELLGQRSPGQRQAGALIKSKGGPVEKLHAAEPSQRALGKIFASPADNIEDLLAGPHPPFLGEPLMIGPPIPLELDLGDSIGPPNTYMAPGPGTFISGGPGGESPGIEVPTPAAAVPEPSTWALMLLGFGMCGYALRRRRQQELSAKEVLSAPS
jgi:hypothetical protein